MVGGDALSVMLLFSSLLPRLSLLSPGLLLFSCRFFSPISPHRPCAAALVSEEQNSLHIRTVVAEPNTMQASNSEGFARSQCRCCG